MMKTKHLDESLTEDESQPMRSGCCSAGAGVSERRGPPGTRIFSGRLLTCGWHLWGCARFVKKKNKKTKPCKLDSAAAATGRNCLRWDKEAVLGNANGDKKLTGNKQEKANRKSPVLLLPPGFYSLSGAPYRQSLQQPAGKEERWFAESLLRPIYGF